MNDPAAPSPVAADEHQLIAASVAGDEDAFRQLVERHYRLVLAVAYRALGSVQAAEDCAQEVFLKVHTHLRSYRADKPFVHWLHRVAANTVTDAIRRRRADLSLQELTREAPSSRTDPAETVAQMEQRMAVRKAVAGLPDHLKSTIVLQVFHELSYQEIAQVLDIPIGTVMSRIFNAKRLLRKRLTEYVREPAGEPLLPPTHEKAAVPSPSPQAKALAASSSPREEGQKRGGGRE